MLIPVSGPDVAPISLEEAKTHCRVDGDEEDALLEFMIEAATRRLDGRDGYLGRALIEQTWFLILDRFAPALMLPLPPIMAVEQVVYTDPAGDQVVLDPSRYRVTGIGSMEGATIRPAPGKSWPATGGPDSVQVEFTAGFGSEPSSVPAPIREAILMHVAHLFEHRESVTLGSGFMMETPHGWADHLEDYRVRGF